MSRHHRDIVLGICVLALLSLGLICLSGVAAETTPPAGQSKVEPSLALDPAVEAVLKGLGDNRIAKLPPAKVTGDFNDIARKYGLDKTGPGIRNYSLKMAWAEDRKRALFCGGNHGVPHGLNDIWEYDLPSNTWVLLWAPDDFTRKPFGRWEDATVKDGILQSKRGATVQASHTWDQMTYDPEIGSLVWLTAWNIAEFLDKQGLSEKLKEKNRHPVPLWGYSPAKNAWKSLGVDQKPTGANNASLLCYIPEFHGVIYYGKGTGHKTFLWDHQTDKWSQFCDSPAAGQGPGDEMLSCYDPKDKVVVAVSASDKGGGTYHFDPAKKTWERTVAWEAGKMPAAMDMNAVIGCDPTTGECLLFANDNASFGFWLYRPAAKEWKRLSPEGDVPPPGGRHNYNGYFDPARGVFVLFQNAGKEVWAYRLATAAKAR